MHSAFSQMSWTIVKLNILGLRLGLHLFSELGDLIQMPLLNYTYVLSLPC